MHDTVGPMTLTVADLRLVLESISGHDPQDPMSVAPAASQTDGDRRAEETTCRITVATDPYYSAGTPDVLRARVEAVRALREDARSVVSFAEVGHPEDAYDIVQRLMVADVCRLYRSSDKESRLGRPFLERSAPGLLMTDADYQEAESMRRQWVQKMTLFFRECDVLVLPGNSVGAPPLEMSEMEWLGQPTSVRKINSECNRLASLIGFPAISMPIGTTADGLPVGIQLVGRPWSERLLMTVATRLENALGDIVKQWGVRVPDLEAV
jgi:aspartyl-tRNA(Asn)/glutamyl-tRNA(Gln) amidotransferase subunit A